METPEEQKLFSIKQWQAEDRPREKMMAKGYAALTDTELLAILIGTGTAKRTAIDLAKEVLATALYDIDALGKFSIKQLQQTNGIGPAKAITIAAALELGRRRQMAHVAEKPVMQRSEDAASLFIPLLNDFQHEVFWVMYLNIKSRLIHHEKVSEGGLSATVVDVRMIYKKALQHNASYIVVAHNHPTGNLTPSAADKELTRRIKEAGKVLEIVLVDHLIIGGNKFLSMADEGYFIR